MNKDEWDYCGHCGAELVEVLVENTFLYEHMIVNRCPHRHWWSREHDEVIIGVRPHPEPKTKFNRKTGGRN